MDKIVGQTSLDRATRLISLSPEFKTRGELFGKSATQRCAISAHSKSIIGSA